MTKIKQEFAVDYVHPFATLAGNEFCCGTEYEIESIKSSTEDLNKLQMDKLLSITSDGSLRNNGKEFITTPMSFDKSLMVFERLHKSLQLGPDPYTHRTSIHVHVNVLELTVEQVESLLHMYALMEPAFFEFAGKQREQNIHCVPLWYTHLPAYYGKELGSIVGAWSKYTAFNLCPIPRQGTIEFRHLYGTGSLTVYQQWLTMIRALYNWARDKSDAFDFFDWLRKDEPIYGLYSEVFGRETTLMNAAFDIPRMDVKLAYTSFK